MRHHANLDILRSFAVSVVLIDHLIPTMQQYLGFSNEAVEHFTVNIGYAGVIAFFVHTSVVLMYSLERMHARMDRVAWRFYVRRFFRLYPLAWFTIALMLVLNLPPSTWHPPEELSRKAILANVLLVQNLWIRKDVVAPLWSLPYEVQMYIVFPAMFLLARRKSGPVWLLGIYCAACVFGVGLHTLTGHLNFAEFIPCFTSGILAYSLSKHVKPRIPGILWPVFVVTMICTYCLTPARFWSAWVFCLVLGVALNLFHDFPVKWINKIAEGVALYSYGVYLLHVPVLYLIFDVMGVTSIPLATVLLFGLTFVASVITFHVLESPCIELGRRLSAGDRVEPSVEDQTVVSAAP